MLTSIQKIFKISLVALLPMVKTKFYMCLYSVYISSSFSIFFIIILKKLTTELGKKTGKKVPLRGLSLRRYSVIYRSIPKPPIPIPGQTPGHLTFLKNFGQMPHNVASLQGQMPHPSELQRGSNPPPSRHVRATVETNFLFSLSSLHTLNKGLYDITI